MFSEKTSNLIIKKVIISIHNSNKFLNKEALKLFQQYQEQLTYEPYGPHFSRIQEKEYKQKCEESMLMSKLGLNKE